jgi:hypothetical protein
MKRTARRVGPWAALLAAIGGAATLATVYGLRVRGIVIFDETLNVVGGRYIYQHFPGALTQSVGVFTRGPERLTALLLAGGDDLSAHTGTQMVAAHVLVATAYAAAALPTYAIARLVGLGRWWAAGAGALAVGTPLLLFGVTLLNTSLSLLTTAIASWVYFWCLLRPRWYADALCILVTGLMATARVSYGGLGAVLLIAIVVQAWRDAPGWRAPLRLLRDHWLLLGGAAATVLYLHVHGVTQVSGYGNVTAVPNTAAIWENLRTSIGKLAVAYALAPFAIGVAWVIRTVARPSDRRTGAFATLALATWLGLAYVNQNGDLEDRYIVALLPLAAVAVVAPLAKRQVRWLECGILGLIMARAVATTESGPSPVGFAHFFATTDTWFANVWLGRARLYLPIAASSVLTVLTVGAALLASAIAALMQRTQRYWQPIGALTLVLTAALGFLGAAYSASKLVPSLPGLSTENPALHATSFSQDAFVDEHVHAPVGVLDYITDEAGVPQQWTGVEMFNSQITSTVRIDGQSSGFTCCLRTGTLLGLGINQLNGEVTVVGGSLPPYLLTVPRWTPGALMSELVMTSPVTDPPVSIERPLLPLRAAWTAPGVPPDGWGLPGQLLRIQVFPTAVSGLPRPCLDVMLTAPPTPPTGALLVNAGSVAITLRPSGSAPAQIPLTPRAARPQDVVIRTSRSGVRATGAPGTVGLADVRISECDR